MFGCEEFISLIVYSLKSLGFCRVWSSGPECRI